jgi:hypothetical protein
MPIVSESNNQKYDDKMNVYIFIFDEWSYRRSFDNKTLIPEFRHLKQFANQALIFHKAVSPGHATALSMPALLLQNKLRYVIGENQLGFQGKQFHPLEEAESIFRYARKEGFYTAMIGHAMPYGELLGEDVDFCKAICGNKKFGDGFFDVAKYHLLTAALMLPDPFFHSERKLITHYFINRFQLDLIATTHDLFKTIVHDLSRPAFAVFHYNLPHAPYFFTRNGYKEPFAVYTYDNVSNYYGNLAYLDEKIGEIIATLKKSNKFDNSLIIMTTDHSWRFDPDYDKTDWRWMFAACHIPLFIKMPHQNRSIEIHAKFETFTLGNFVKEYLHGSVTLADVETLLSKEHFFTPTPLESEDSG